MEPTHNTPLTRLGGAVALWRRVYLGTSQAEARTRAGVSDRTWRKVEQGLPVNATSRWRVERALGWPIGTIDGILAGDPPPELPTEPPGAPPGLAVVPEIGRGVAVSDDVDIPPAAPDDADDADTTYLRRVVEAVRSQNAALRDIITAGSAEVDALRDELHAMSQYLMEIMERTEGGKGPQ